MTDEELLKFYEINKKFSFRMDFYDCDSYITLEDIIRLINLKKEESNEDSKTLVNTTAGCTLL